jgi:hypothetical protein
MARLMPISRVRSATLIAIVLMTDRPPTIRLMAATPKMIALKIVVVAPTVSFHSAPVTVALFSTVASMADATAAKSAPSSGYTMIWLATSSATSDSATSGGRSPR